MTPADSHRAKSLQVVVCSNSSRSRFVSFLYLIESSYLYDSFGMFQLPKEVQTVSILLVHEIGASMDRVALLKRDLFGDRLCDQ